ncbi:FtsK/SpoIIIE domain-containing protein [Peribacillus simplex]|uniref:FtsK/SpoIIIE domain-containing protein n=1 Tax=Peribacillus simplex TaxID=1478 RepID=UPI0024C14BD1|nr:FtsK/SpoIIIE domain-containing protein [Peribacillus simplex]WHY54322.1 FtsK/SpoIIIE domain-containing protein [Peribacillus simplex]
MNIFAEQMISYLTTIQKNIEDYMNQTEQATRDYTERKGELTISFDKKMKIVNKETKKKINELKDRTEKDLAYILFLIEKIKGLEECFCSIDAKYAGRKSELNRKKDSKYPFLNIDNPAKELEMIFHKVAEIETDLVKKRGIFRSINRADKYAELSYLVSHSSDLYEKTMNELYEEYYDYVSKWVKKARMELRQLEERKQQELQQLNSQYLSKVEEAGNILKNELDRNASSKSLHKTALTINSQEPNLSLYTPPNEEDEPVIQIGFISNQLTNLNITEQVQEVIKNKYSDWMHENWLMLPYALQFGDNCSLLIKTNTETEAKVNKGIQAIITRMLAQIPPTKLHCIFIDPKNAGTIFSAFMRIAHKDEKVVGKQVYTSPPDINHALDDIYAHIDSVIQFKLSAGVGFTDIYEYNKFAKENAESYKLLTILDYPKNFTADMKEKLMYIVENGPKCGVHTIITYNEKNAGRHQKNEFNQDIEWLASQAIHIRNQGEDLYISSSDEVHFDFVSPPKLPHLVKFVNDLEKHIVAVNKRGTPFSVIVPDKWFSRRSSDSLTVPLGRTGAGDTHELLFGVDTSQHAIVAGKTGSGKTTLLHTLITSACINYSPDELQFYLLDFKEGVEFMEYANYKIPHMKLLALESEQEFGESILMELQDELTRRGGIFKEHGVQNIMNYRKKTGEKMPRILLIIDEFQVLFDSHINRKIAGNCGFLIDDLVRRGRSFGIHIILASQSISSAVNSTFEPITRSQMAVRIGLKADEKDAKILLGDDNNGIATLGQEMGVAIYNSDSGNAPNIKFKIAYLDKENQEKTLQTIHEYSTSQGYVYNARVFVSQMQETIAKANIPMNAPLEDYKKRTRGITLWMGKSNRVSPPYLTLNLNYRNEDNIMILGQDEELARKVLYGTLCSVLFHYQTEPGVTARKIIFADYPSPDKDEKDGLDYLVEELPEYVEGVKSDKEFLRHLNTLHEEMSNRKHGKSFDKTPCFFFIHGVQRSNAAYDKSVNSYEDSHNDSHEDSPKINFLEGNVKFDIANMYDAPKTLSDEKYMANVSTNQKFVELLKNGPSQGIYIIMWCDQNSNFIDLTDWDPIKSFGHRFACRLREDESRSYMGEEYASLLKRDSLIYRDLRGDFHKLQPFEYPNVSWRNGFVEKITHRIKS